jgi:putative spermidine/putrescine transport system permease protein
MARRSAASGGGRSARLAILAAAPLLMMLLLFEILPLIAVGLDGLHTDSGWSLANYAAILASPFQRNAFLLSVELSLATAVLGVVIALPVAVVLRRVPKRVSRALLVYATIGANFTGFPIAFAFIIMFGLAGFFTLLLVHAGWVHGLNIYSLGGLVAVYVYFQFQLGLLLLMPALEAITPDLRDAARVMGASDRVFWLRIGLPILAPALISAFVFLFANAMGTYATAYALVGGNANIVTIRIGELLAGDVFSDPHLADALASLLVIGLAIPIVLEQILLHRRRDG